MESKKITSLQQQNSILKKIVRDKLGIGVWGLKRDSDDFSHEEILFLFSRIFPVLGIDYIKKIRTNFPDCICVKDSAEIAIEFEPVLSNFKDHLSKDDITKCDCIVCWKDDLLGYDGLRDELTKYNIEVIELKTYYEKYKIKDKQISLEWNAKDLESLSDKQLKLLRAYINSDKDILTKEELSKLTNIKGKALGGVIGGFKYNKVPLVSKHPKGWQLNNSFRDKIIQTLIKFKYL